MGLLSRVFRLKPKVDFNKLIKQGAIVIDVRSSTEFSNGHIKKSMNIPLELLQNRSSKFKKDVPILLCCATGVRSSTARRFLKKQGFEAYNAGGWASLNRKLQ